MNRQEMYDAWRKHGRHIKVGPDFTGRVIARIEQRMANAEPHARKASPWWRLVAARPWAKAAVIATGATLGLTRVILTLHLILFA